MELLGQWVALAETFLAQHGWVLWALAGLSVATLALSVLLIPILIVRIPADYYSRPVPPRERRSAVRQAVSLVRNLLGAALFLAGVGMLFLPGQGFLTILAALALLEFPGKRALELRILRTPGIGELVAWIRARAGKPALKL